MDRSYGKDEMVVSWMFGFGTAVIVAIVVLYFYGAC